MGRGQARRRGIIGLFSSGDHVPERAERVYEREFAFLDHTRDLPGGLFGALDRAIREVQASRAELGGAREIVDFLRAMRDDYRPTFYDLAARTLLSIHRQEIFLGAACDSPGVSDPRLAGKVSAEQLSAIWSELLSKSTADLRTLLSGLIAVDGLESQLVRRADLPSYLRPLIAYTRAAIDVAEPAAREAAAADRGVIAEFWSAPVIDAVLRRRFWRRMAWHAVAGDAELDVDLAALDAQLDLPEAAGVDQETRREREEAHLLIELDSLVREKVEAPTIELALRPVSGGQPEAPDRAAS